MRLIFELRNNLESDDWRRFLVIFFGLFLSLPRSLEREKGPILIQAKIFCKERLYMAEMLCLNGVGKRVGYVGEPWGKTQPPTHKVQGWLWVIKQGELMFLFIFNRTSLFPLKKKHLTSTMWQFFLWVDFPAWDGMGWTEFGASSHGSSFVLLLL